VESVIKQINQRVRGARSTGRRPGAEAILQLRADYPERDGGPWIAFLVGPRSPGREAAVPIDAPLKLVNTKDVRAPAPRLGLADSGAAALRLELSELSQPAPRLSPLSSRIGVILLEEPAATCPMDSRGGAGGAERRAVRLAGTSVCPIGRQAREVPAVSRNSKATSASPRST